MSSYNYNLIHQELSQAAVEARRRVLEIERGAPDPHLDAQHDELLGRIAVYDFLRARSMLHTRSGMLSELQWYLTSPVQAPSNAFTAHRFESGRVRLVQSLITRFQRLRSEPIASPRFASAH